MKFLIRESLSAAVLAVVTMPINAVPINAEVCTPVHETLKNIGAGQFYEKLLARGIDFKYGQFTIFAPSDRLLRTEELVLRNDGHNNTTINDILLFHVSAANITESITDPAHCGKPLLMLNEDLSVNQEYSTTDCAGDKVYQLGPGNIVLDTAPLVVGDPIQACDSVIYNIAEALLLPTIPNMPLAPTAAPKPTPPRQETPKPTIAPTKRPTEAPIEAPTESSANDLLSMRGSLILAAFASLVVSYL